MKNLFEKHEHNLRSARILIDDHKLYAPSVHCSYYSYFQFLKCKTHASKGKINSSIPKNFGLGTGSHEVEFVKFLNHYNIDRKTTNLLVREFTNLKTNRKKADYKDEVINEILAKSILNKAKKQITIIQGIK